MSTKWVPPTGKAVLHHAKINLLLRLIGHLPDELFKEFLIQTDFFQESSFSCQGWCVSISTDQRAEILSFSSFDTVAEVTEVILKKYTQGITWIDNCPTSGLEGIARLNPKALRRYEHVYAV